MKATTPARPVRPVSVGLLDDTTADDDGYDPRVGAGAGMAPKKHGGLAAFVGAVGNFSVQANFQSLSAAVAIMTAAAGVPIPKGNPDHLVADYPEPVRRRCGVAAEPRGGTSRGGGGAVTRGVPVAVRARIHAATTLRRCGARAVDSAPIAHGRRDAPPRPPPTPLTVRSTATPP